MPSFSAAQDVCRIQGNEQRRRARRDRVGHAESGVLRISRGAAGRRRRSRNRRTGTGSGAAAPPRMISQRKKTTNVITMNRARVLHRALGLLVHVHGLQQADAERGRLPLWPASFSRSISPEQPARLIAPAEVRHAPVRREPRRADAARCRAADADEARMRPRRGELYGRLGARGEHAQIAAAVDVEVEVKRHHGASAGTDARSPSLRLDTRGEYVRCR